MVRLVRAWIETKTMKDEDIARLADAIKAATHNAGGAVGDMMHAMTSVMKAVGDGLKELVNPIKDLVKALKHTRYGMSGMLRGFGGIIRRLVIFGLGFLAAIGTIFAGFLREFRGALALVQDSRVLGVSPQVLERLAFAGRETAIRQSDTDSILAAIRQGQATGTMNQGASAYFLAGTRINPMTASPEQILLGVMRALASGRYSGRGISAATQVNLEHLGFGSQLASALSLQGGAALARRFLHYYNTAPVTSNTLVRTMAKAEEGWIRFEAVMSKFMMELSAKFAPVVTALANSLMPFFSRWADSFGKDGELTRVVNSIAKWISGGGIIRILEDIANTLVYIADLIRRVHNHGIWGLFWGSSSSKAQSAPQPVSIASHGSTLDTSGHMVHMKQSGGNIHNVTINQYRSNAPDVADSVQRQNMRTWGIL